MKILEMRAIRGSNYYHRKPVIFMQLDLEELEAKPTDLVPDFKDNIARMLPGLYKHTCSPGEVGGFFERLESGTWAGHVIEHVAIELQGLAGHEVAYGKTYTMDEPGIYNVVYRYVDEDTGLRAGEMAVELVAKLFAGISTEVAPLIEELKQIAQSGLLGPSTQSIVDEAARRGIPHIRLNDESFVQLGYGKYQRRIQATLMDSTSALGVEIADDKERTKQILTAMGIPVPRGRSVNTFEDALSAADEIGYPVVVKPLVGNHGRGVTVNVTDPEGLLTAFQVASAIYRTCVVEKYIEGFDYRILVIDGKFVAAALREPAFVIGNGSDSVRRLIDEVNEDPERGDGHEKNLTRITIDGSMTRLLDLQQLTLDTVLARGRKLYVKETANLSTGGTALDVTETVHPLNQRMAERISRLIGLNVMGIDVVAPTLETPLEEGTSGIVEVNAAPGFRMHLNPSDGTPRNIAANVVDMLFPTGVEHSIPICAVTGTNGKTTTTRLIDHILKVNGHCVGMASTDAVTIDQVPILKGDYSGPEGARMVFTDASVDHAVLEVARGGILRRGLGFDACDVGILLNISSDHLGEGGIDTLEELTRLKSTVTEAVKPSGTAIFNADDPRVMACVAKSQGQPILFSKDPDNPELKANLGKGHWNVTVADGRIILQEKAGNTVIAPVNDIPITFQGKAGFNIENAMAAAAAASALGLTPGQIREGLLSFNPSIEQSAGRMNVFDMGEFKVIVDYSHNVQAVHATGELVRNLMPGRTIRMASGVGNRRREDILEFGRALSRYYDHIILCDADPRERKSGETARIVRQGLLEGGFTPEGITVVINETEAVKAAIGMARPGDLVVLQVDDIDQVIQDVLDHQAKIVGSLSRKTGEVKLQQPAATTMQGNID